MDKTYLEHLLSSYNWWMGVSTIAVAVGILGEYVAHFVFEEEARRNKREMAISVLFGLLVLGGVVGEYIFGKKLTQVSERLQQIADVEVAQSNKDAAAARKDAELARTQSAATYERAAQAEQHTAQENARAAKALQAAEVARKNAEGFSLQIAHANERAANAERASAELKEEAARLTKEAESEHLARVRLEQQLSWRDLTPEQSQRIARKLLPFTGQQFDFVTYGSEGECINFENELYRIVLTGGHWLLDPKRQWHMLVQLVVGIEVQVPEKADASTKNAASALADALTVEGVSSTLKTIPAEDSPNAAVITITVGKNPKSMVPIEPAP